MPKDTTPATAKPATRIYRVDAIEHTPAKLVNTKPRLIQASSQAAALAFACKDLYSIKVCDVADALELRETVVENAGQS